MLPIGPVGYADSPYLPFSTFAGNPLFLDLHVLREQGLLTDEEVAAAFSDRDFVEYSEQSQVTMTTLPIAFDGSALTKPSSRFACEKTG